MLFVGRGAVALRMTKSARGLAEIGEILLRRAICALRVGCILASLLRGSICKGLAVVRLSSSLGCANLILSTNESAVSHLGFSSFLGLSVKTLRAASLFQSFHSLIVVITLEELLDAGSL